MTSSSTPHTNIMTQESFPASIQITTGITSYTTAPTTNPDNGPGNIAIFRDDNNFTSGTGTFMPTSYPPSYNSTASWYSYGFYSLSSTSSNMLGKEITHYEELEIFLAVLFIVLSLATIVGNVMALTVFTRIPVTKTVSVIFFTSMAIADLCNGIFVMPFSVYSLLNERRIIKGLTALAYSNNTTTESLRNYCTFSGIVMNTSTKAALFTLILICFDRFISVRDALHVHLIMTVKNCSILVIACWLSALMLALFPFFLPDAFDVEKHQVTSFNYRYVDLTAQCTYRVEEVFNMFEVRSYLLNHITQLPNGNVLVQYPYYVNLWYFFLNILPIIIPTYLIVFFCVAVIVILRRIFKNSKRIIQQIEPPDLKRNRSFRNSVNLSFKRKACEKPITMQMNKVDAGYTEIHKAQGTAPEHLEGEVVLRRASRKITQPVNVNAGRSPNLAKDRWSQISVKSLQKRTKADHQKKAINTVILMLLFFVFCYTLEWLFMFAGFFYYLGLIPNLANSMPPLFVNYLYILITIAKYLNCAGNPFLYYFRMSQFQKEVRGMTQSFGGTPNNRVPTSGSSSSRSYRSKKGYVSLVGKSSSSNKSSGTRNKYPPSSYKYRASRQFQSPPR